MRCAFVLPAQMIRARLSSAPQPHTLQVASPANAELLSNLEVDVSLMNDAGSSNGDDSLLEAGSGVVGPDLIDEQSMLRVIFKSNDDLRQEMFAMLLIHIIRTAWLDDNLDLYLREYRVLSISPSSGLVEVVPDSASIDSLKKGNGCLSLARHFANSFGAGSAAYDRAVAAYINSLAGYSLLSHILNIKDRHNGNILLLGDGHLVHIDFGFFFSIAPGGITFESAPFKMTRDFCELVGPNVMSNPRYQHVDCCEPIVTCLFARFLIAPVQLRQARGVDDTRNDQLAQARASNNGLGSGARSPLPPPPSTNPPRQHTFDIVGTGYPCFKLGQRAVDDLHARYTTLNPKPLLNPCRRRRVCFDGHCRFFTEVAETAMQHSVQGLLSQSWGNQRSSIYDYFQYKTNGILY
jgi:hypothetical protein